MYWFAKETGVIKSFLVPDFEVGINLKQEIRHIVL
jgi:hypothetical protein